MSNLVAVIDIGKTNKKVAIYDDNLQQCAYIESSFAAEMNADGILCEPVEPMWDWFGEQLQVLYKKHPFAAISITTHGATIACLDEHGELSVPLVAYDHPLSDDEQAALDKRFYDIAGKADELQNETGTCDLPLLINPAKAICFYQERFPDAWSQTAHILNYPQYWAYRLTGAITAEPTYTFNHSFLHDVRSQQPSTAATKLGCAELLPPKLNNCWDAAGTLLPELQEAWGLPALPVTTGIHDSNAALLPYLAKYPERDFVVNSTGTWCVSMHKVQDVVYKPHELGLKIIFNVDALNGYQKTSFLMGGQDYALYHGLIGGEHPAFDAIRLNTTLINLSDAIVPGAFPSQFATVKGGAKAGDRWFTVEELENGTTPDWWSDQDKAHDLLNISLALQTKVALQNIGVEDGTAIFIEGGFRNNPAYLALIAALFPTSQVVSTSLKQATATGAALLGHALLSDQRPEEFASHLEITEEPISAPALPALAAYAELFFKDMR